MCGISGLLNLDGSPVSSVHVKGMTDALSHRGPDGEGHWIERNIGIGHRRLSIIDLSESGNQPMLSANGRYILTFNGEIYNYLDIRKKLERRGIRFFSKTDSEVVLNALAQWGTDYLKEFNGMFALALFDRKANKLLLARDRYGIKPLYYSKQAKSFAFASEQKAIITLPGFTRVLNKAALYEYFTFQNIFTNQTLLNDIFILKPGHFGELEISSGIWKTHEYWDYNFKEPNFAVDAQEYTDELGRLFKQAVKRQLVGDVELGAYLSGGLDSGSINAVACQEFPNLKSFTCGFDISSAEGIELSFDERSTAEAMSSIFKTEHYQMVLKAGDMERCLPKVAWHLEEPRVGQSYPNYYSSKLASKFVKVILSGTGGDELFGGYPWRYYRAIKAGNFEEYIDQYYLYWQRLLSNKELKKMFAPIFSEVEHVWTRDIFRGVFGSRDRDFSSPEECINNSLYFEAKTFLHGLFVVEDKLSMAHGLENRVPFMDNDLVNFAMQCPIGLKLKNFKKIVRINENDIVRKSEKYFQQTNDGKQILRKMMSKYVPKKIIEAKKQGFSSPDASWFKGESIDFVRKVLIQNNANIYNIFDRDVVVSLINDHFEGSKNRRLLIWSLLNIEEWMKQYL